MNGDIIYPALLIISGILVSSVVIIFLTRFSNKITRFFGFYPESRTILAASLKIVSWLIGLIIFFVFLRLSLKMLDLEFTKNLVEDIITASPRYIIAVFLVMAGFYVSRTIKERSKSYKFEHKGIVVLVLDLIIHLTFVFTALYTIGVNIAFFLELYKVLLWVTGAVFGLIVSMAIGIPLGISICRRMKMGRECPKKKNK